MTITAPPATELTVSLHKLKKAYQDEDLTWHQRTLRPLIGARLDTLDRLLGVLESSTNEPSIDSPRLDHLEREVTQALYHLVPYPGGRINLCCYLAGHLLNAWDRAIDHGQIKRVVRRICSSMRDHLEGVSRGLDLEDVQRAELAVLAYQAEHDIGRLEAELRVEEAVNAGCPKTTERAAHHVVELLGNERRALEAGDFGSFGPVMEAYDDRLRDDDHYYDSIERAARAVRGLLDEDRDPEAAEVLATAAVVAIDHGVAAIADSDEGSGNASWASEIRAHGDALKKLIEASRLPQLHIDEGTITYLYPFSFWGAGPIKAEALLDACRDQETGSWTRGPLAELQPEAIEPMLVTDVWSGFHVQSTVFMEDTHRSKGDELTTVFDGGLIRLPDLALALARHDEDDEDDERIVLKASILVTRAGTHAVRLETELEDASPHELYRAMRRGAKRLAADDRLFEVCGDGSLHPRADVRDLTDLAGTIANDLATVVTKVIAEKGLGTEGRQVEVVTIPEAEHHTILRIGEMSKVLPGGDVVPIDATGLVDSMRGGRERLAGARLLTTPLTRDAAALEEWVNVPPACADDLIGELDLVDERIHLLGPTTVLIMTKSPEWLAWEYAEAAELVAILPPMFNRWRHELNEVIVERSDLLRDIRTQGHGRLAIEQKRERLEEIRESLLQVRTLAGRARGLLARYRSDEICKTAQHRCFLDTLMKASPITRLEASLDDRLELSDQLFAGIEEDLAKAYDAGTDDRTRKFEIAVQRIGALLAAFALADLLAFVHGGLTLPAWVVAPFVGLLILTAVLIYQFVNFALDRPPDEEEHTLRAYAKHLRCRMEAMRQRVRRARS